MHEIFKSFDFTYKFDRLIRSRTDCRQVKAKSIRRLPHVQQLPMSFCPLLNPKRITSYLPSLSKRDYRLRSDTNSKILRSQAVLEQSLHFLSCLDCWCRKLYTCCPFLQGKSDLLICCCKYVKFNSYHHKQHSFPKLHKQRSWPTSFATE